jgi:GNAT superfamily N-acetyltransferase
VLSTGATVEEIAGAALDLVNLGPETDEALTRYFQRPAPDQPAAPPAASVVAALKTEPFLRSAEQKTAVNLAEARLSEADQDILRRAARAPFTLSLEERNRLRDLNNGVKMSSRRGDPRAVLEQEARRRGGDTATVQMVDPATLPRAADTQAPGPDELQALSAEVYGAVERVTKLLGQKVVLFDSPAINADGFVRTDDPSTIYLNVRSQKPHMAVVGHEVTHQMKRHLRHAYDAFEQVVRSQRTDEAPVLFSLEYGPGANVEELSGDLMGNRFQENAFWTDVFTQIEKNLGAKAAPGVVMRLGALIEKTVQAAKRALFNATGFQADSYVKDLDAVRAAAKKALALYAANRREAAQAAATAPTLQPEAALQAPPTLQPEAALQAPPTLQPEAALQAPPAKASERRGVTVRPLDDGLGFEALDESGKRIGLLRDNLKEGQAEQLDEVANVSSVAVDRAARGQGVGRALYQAFERKHGGRIAPSGQTTADAWRVWKRNYPQKVEAFAQQEARRIADGADARVVLGNITDKDVAARVYALSAKAGTRDSTRRYSKAEVSAALGALTPQERAKLRRDTIERMLAVLRSTPSADEFAAVAYAGRAKRGWYEDAARAIVNVFGADAPRFVALLAALSPKTSVENNLTNALRTWANWTQAGRPRDPIAIKRILGRSVQGNKGEKSVLKAWLPNSIRALTTESQSTLSGPKVNSFMLNLLGQTEEVTLDAWMANFTLIDQKMFQGELNAAGTDPGKGSGYLAVAARVRQAANRLTELTGERWTPAEVQETVWAWAKTLYEAQKEGSTATDILYNEELTDDLIRSTPDFYHLLKTPANAAILEQAGLGERVARLDRGQDRARERRNTSETPPFDSAAQAAFENSAARRLERLKEKGEAAFRKPGRTKASARRTEPHRAVVDQLQHELPLPAAAMLPKDWRKKLPADVLKAVEPTGVLDGDTPIARGDLARAYQSVMQQAPILNIGLSPNEAKEAPPTVDEALGALRSMGARVIDHVVHTSDSEPTLVVRIQRALSEKGLDALSGRLRQDAVAQRLAPGAGMLAGPKASLWGPYNPEYFVLPSGERDAAPVKNSARRTEDPAFKKWFGLSRVVDGKGQPLVVYHGTVADFIVFSREFLSATSDLGAGFYFSSSPLDAGANYAGEGPDMQVKIEREAERRLAEIDDLDASDMLRREKALRDEVRREWFQNEGVIMPVYLSMGNPVVLTREGRNDGTFFTLDEPYDEDTETFGEPTGTLLPILTAIDDNSDDFGVDAQRLKQTVLERAADYGGVSAFNLFQLIVENEFPADPQTGDFIPGEFFRRLVADAGYDGFIDHTVDRFSMEGTSNATHYIVFDPAQIKSATGNRGTYHRRDPNILESRRRVQPTGLYSALEEAVSNMTMKSAPAAAWSAAIKGMVNKGTVKTDEVLWSGVEEWLGLQSGKVDRDALADYLKNKTVRVKAQALFSAEDGDPDQKGGAETPIYTQYTVPGGSQHEEVLLQLNLPNSPVERLREKLDSMSAQLQAAEQGGADKEELGRLSSARERMLVTIAEAEARSTYLTDHWPTKPNVLAHVRLTTRTVTETAPSSPDQDAALETRRELEVRLIELRVEQEKLSASVQKQHRAAWAAKLAELSGTTPAADLVSKALASLPTSYPESARIEEIKAERAAIMARLPDVSAPKTVRKKLLFVEEIQSDWGQDARKRGVYPAAQLNGIPPGYTVYDDAAEARRNGHDVSDGVKGPWFYRGPGVTSPLYPTREEAIYNAWLDSNSTSLGAVPDAPFIDSTDKWVALALKHVLHKAAKGGYDAVVMTSGAWSADHYDLEFRVQSLTYMPPVAGGWGVLRATGYGADSGSRVQGLEENTKTLRNILGPDLASRLLAAPADPDTGSRTLDGLDELIGGYGMRQFYDNVVPLAMTRLAKKLPGAKRGTVTLNVPVLENTGIPASQFQSIELNQQARDNILLGQTLFSTRRAITGDSGRAYTKAQVAMFERTGRSVEKPTTSERLAALRKDFWKNAAQGLADQFRPIKDVDLHAYTLLRLSRGTAGAIEAFLHHGKLSVGADGAYDADLTGGVIDRLAIPLHGELEDFLWWVAANRADRLSAEDRENLFTPQDIAAGRSLASGTTSFDYKLPNGRTTRDRSLIYADALRVFNEFNRNAMDLAERSGLIDGATRPFWEHEFYVPFYRVADDQGGFVGAQLKNGIVRQTAFKQLKGGKDKLNSDLLHNTLQNWAHLIDAAAKNRAAKATLEAVAKMGGAIEADEATVRALAKGAGMRSNVVWFLDQGRARHFLIEDRHILEAVTALEYAGMRGPLMDALGWAKKWLTVGVTLRPAFKVRNLIRDTVSAIAVSELSANPLQNLAQGVRATDKASQTYVSALASGGLIRFGTMLEGSHSERVRQLVAQGVDESTILDSEDKIGHMRHRAEQLFSAYQELGNRGEELNRAALYAQLRAKGWTNADAALQARDLLDFSMQGTWTSVRFLSQTVPFFNARVQGMYKLGRAATENPQRLGAVVGATAALSLLLLAAFKGDDEWEKREDWDRDNYWWFRMGGIAYRIPKPFELGAVATMAERTAELMMSDELTGAEFLRKTRKLLMDQLAMNPVPQALRPVIDLYANKDSFTGRPIESASMERLQPDYRYTSASTLPARALSTAGQSVAERVGGSFLSPVQIDHLVRSYFGWLGTMVVSSTDMLVRPATSEPVRPAVDAVKTFSMQFAEELPANQSRYVTQLYEQARTLESAYGTWRMLQKTGRAEEAREFLAENREDIVRAKKLSKDTRRLSLLNEQARAVERSRTLDPVEKRERLRAIKERQHRLAKRAMRAPVNYDSDDYDSDE